MDATSRIVYRGIVPELIRDKPCVNLMKGSPVYKAAQEALKRMAPLSLTDPKAENFNPEGCRSLHDVIRFSHEMGMREMFNIGGEMEDAHGAVRLRCGVPQRPALGQPGAADLRQGRLAPGTRRRLAGAHKRRCPRRVATQPRCARHASRSSLSQRRVPTPCRRAAASGRCPTG